MKTTRHIALSIVAILLPVVALHAADAIDSAPGASATVLPAEAPASWAGLDETPEAGDLQSMAYLAFGSGLLLAYHRRTFRFRRSAAAPGPVRVSHGAPPVGAWQ